MWPLRRSIFPTFVLAALAACPSWSAQQEPSGIFAGGNSETLYALVLRPRESRLFGSYQIIQLEPTGDRLGRTSFSVTGYARGRALRLGLERPGCARVQMQITVQPNGLLRVLSLGAHEFGNPPAGILVPRFERISQALFVSIVQALQSEQPIQARFPNAPLRNDRDPLFPRCVRASR